MFLLSNLIHHCNLHLQPVDVMLHVRSGVASKDKEIYEITDHDKEVQPFLRKKASMLSMVKLF